MRYDTQFLYRLANACYQPCVCIVTDGPVDWWHMDPTARQHLLENITCAHNQCLWAVDGAGIIVPRSITEAMGHISRNVGCGTCITTRTATNMTLVVPTTLRYIMML